MHIAIIGGGAAGFAAAIAAAGKGAAVTVLERNIKPLKKLGVTGNGRGNILNAGKPVYFGDSAFAKAVLTHVGFEELKQVFQTLGIPLREESEGRIYPASLQASAVQDALILRGVQLGIAVRCLVRVENITREKDGFLIRGMQGQIEKTKLLKEVPYTLRADKVIVACGGAAAPVHGTDGTAYDLLTTFGHRCTKLLPALCALKVPKKHIRGLAGQRVRAELRLVDAQGNPVRKTRGEVLFGEDAVSGIAAMQLARFSSEGMQLCLDLRDELKLEQDTLSFVQSLAAMRLQQPMADLFVGAFATPVSRWILREAGIRDVHVLIETAGSMQLRRLADTIEGVCIPVIGTRGFDCAQVTAGGIETKEFNPETMESRLVPGLFAAGEILNVDGECGGFNLMFAFASGITAGNSVGCSA